MTKEEILHLATLSRIRMNDEEVTKFQGEIQSILEYVGTINKIVANNELTKSPGPVHNVFRTDEVTNQPEDYADDLLKAFPDSSGRYLRVRKILNPDN